MKQSSGFDKFFMAKGKVITAINAEFGLMVMTVMGLPDSCLKHGLRLYCNKSAILPSRSALPDHQYVPEHPYRIAPAQQRKHEYRTQAWSDLPHLLRIHPMLYKARLERFVIETPTL